MCVVAACTYEFVSSHIHACYTYIFCNMSDYNSDLYDLVLTIIEHSIKRRNVHKRVACLHIRFRYFYSCMYTMIVSVQRRAQTRWIRNEIDSGSEKRANTYGLDKTSLVTMRSPCTWSARNYWTMKSDGDYLEREKLQRKSNTTGGNRETRQWRSVDGHIWRAKYISGSINRRVEWRIAVFAPVYQ